MSTDAPTRPTPPPPAAPPMASTRSGSSGAGPKQAKRDYVVIEEKPDGTIVRAGEEKALTPDDACWQLVEKADTDLNKRAKSDKAADHPKLQAIAKGGFVFTPYKLQVETVVKRSKRDK